MRKLNRKSSRARVLLNEYTKGSSHSVNPYLLTESDCGGESYPLLDKESRKSLMKILLLKAESLNMIKEGLIKAITRKHSAYSIVE